DHERHEVPKHVVERPARHRDHAPAHGLAHERGQVLAVRLLRLAVPDELHADHRAEAADLPDLLDLIREVVPPRADRLAHDLRTLHEALLLDHLQDGVGRRAGHRVADVRAADRGGPGRVHDVAPADHGRQRIPGAGTTKPPSPWIGSTMAAATVPGSTTVVKPRSRASSARRPASSPSGLRYG